LRQWNFRKNFKNTFRWFRVQFGAFISPDQGSSSPEMRTQTFFLLAALVCIGVAEHGVDVQNKDYLDIFDIGDGIGDGANSFGGNGLDSFGNQMSNGLGAIGPTIRELFQGWMQLFSQEAQGGGTVGSQVRMGGLV
jgi:hypothetical protein